MTLRPLLFVLAIALAAAGCTADTTTGDQSEFGKGTGSSGARVIELRLSEFAFLPDAVRVAPGETVRFEATNEGVIEHELRLTNETAIAEHLDEGHGDGHSDAAAGPAVEDLVVLVAPGLTATLEVVFPNDPAAYTALACLLPGHYEAGMTGEITYSE